MCFQVLLVGFGEDGTVHFELHPVLAHIAYKGLYQGLAWTVIFGLRLAKGCCGLNGWLCKGHFSALRSEGRILKDPSGGRPILRTKKGKHAFRPWKGPFTGFDHNFLVILVREGCLEAGIAHQIDIL